MFEQRAWLVVVAVGLCGAGAGACSVDERTLEPRGSSAVTEAGAGDGVAGTDAEQVGDAGAGAGGAGSGSAGAVSGPAAGGDGSEPAVLTPLVDGCADLDTDGVADCKVTLVKNPSFASDVDDWQAMAGASLVWDARNALADLPSGCGLLTATGTSALAGSSLVRARQCVSVPPGQLAIAYANVWVKASSPAAQAEVEVSYFDSADCSGQSTGYFVTPPNAEGGAWVTVQAGGVSGATTKSALVELVGVKPNSLEQLTACFDNVMLKTQPL